jgi:hypothetical protein
MYQTFNTSELSYLYIYESVFKKINKIIIYILI